MAIITDFNEQKLIPAAPGNTSRTGESVSVYGVWMATSAPYYNNPETFNNEGAVYIYELVDDTWVERQQLGISGLPNSEFISRFGSSVSIYEDTLVVGATGTSIGTLWNAGTAYVFKLISGIWQYQQQLVQSDPESYEEFGNAVKVHENTIAVSSYSYNYYQGRVRIFENTGSSWAQVQEIIRPDGENYDSFGVSLDIYGDTMVIGCPGKTTGTQYNHGVAYVYRYIPDSYWQEEQVLFSSEYAEYDSFGQSVSIFESTILVGAPNVELENENKYGAVYIFSYETDTWAETQKFYASVYNGFGSAVSIYENMFAVGAPTQNSYSGTVYIYSFADGNWLFTRRLVGTSLDQSSYFGFSVSVYGDRIAAGAPGETTSPFYNQGAVYIYKRTTRIVDETIKLSVYRKKEKLINTSLFKSASIYEERTDNKIYQLPIYDPFKAILPGPAKQNLYYISLKDPARYNVTPDPVLFSENITFAEEQVGRLWWDTSTMRYVYYEQPKNITGTESELYNIEYRRNHWGEMFPGSSVDVYEWVKSSVPPSKYKGSGIPRDINTYVEIVVPNRLTNSSSSTYYFWVKNKTDRPNLPNRTMAALQVANLLKNPKSLNFAFFSPISQTSEDNSYMFYNVQSILAYRGNNVQIQYRLSESEVQEHTQWSLYRDGDPSVTISSQYWDKMVDSLCGYTAPIPASDEFVNGILIFKDIGWDIPSPTWDNFNWDGELQGEILPVPDPSLAENEKYGIEYRPRQSMFRDIYAARKIFVQAANQLLKHIPIIEVNDTWNKDISTSNYWKYITWYERGYEDVVPTIVFQTITEASLALAQGRLGTHDIVQVTNAQSGDRFIIYSVVQSNGSMTFKEVAIERSSIAILDSLYEVKNSYQLSVELRQILDALRTQVLINDYRVDQNRLFFSMMNYVMSEQKSPDWLFKTSYIYVRENDVPLDQKLLLVPDKTDSIMGYIEDAKPYHTKLRDYTTSHETFDLADGTSSDNRLMKVNLKFGPLPLDFSKGEEHYIVDAKQFTDDIEQFISKEDVYTVVLDNYTPEKRGYSQLYPYTFNLSSLTINDPQTFVPPRDVVGVQQGTQVLIYGRDYFVEYNNDQTYTVYFYKQPTGTGPLVALIWIDGGKLEYIGFNAYRNETALTYPKDGMVVLSDTRLPVNDVSMIIDADWAPKTVAPYVGWGDVWEELLEEPIRGILDSYGGMGNIPWDSTPVPRILPETISFRQATDFDNNTRYYRNGASLEGTLLTDLPSPTADTDNIQTIRISVESNILPDSRKTPGVIWIDGERIEYMKKRRINTTTYELSEIRRGTSGTAEADHYAMVPSISTGVLVPNKVWVERGTEFPPNSSGQVWNANIQFVEPEEPKVAYMYADYVPIGGLWYARTPQSVFLKKDMGNAINE